MLSISCKEEVYTVLIWCDIVGKKYNWCVAVHEVAKGWHGLAAEQQQQQQLGNWELHAFFFKNIYMWTSWDDLICTCQIFSKINSYFFNGNFIYVNNITV